MQPLLHFLFMTAALFTSVPQETAPSKEKDSRDPEKLITEARRQTDWIFGIKTLQMQVRHKTVRSAGHVQEARARFRRQNKEIADLDAAIAERPFLQAEATSFETTIWTRKKYYHRMKGKRTDTTTAWDGVDGVNRSGWFDPEKAPRWYRARGGPITDLSAFGYFYSVLPEEWARGGFELMDIESLRKQRPMKQPDVTEFKYFGRSDFHGHDCFFVWRLDGTNEAIAIDAGTGRYRGHRYVSLLCDRPGEFRKRWAEVVREHYASKGEQVTLKTVESLLKNKKDQAYKTCMQLVRARRTELVRMATLEDTLATSDLVIFEEREIRPGCWFPVRERYTSYDIAAPTTQVSESSTRDVFRLKVDEPIPDESIFTLVIPKDASNVEEVRPRKKPKP